jgi:hypothetical protein
MNPWAKPGSYYLTSVAMKEADWVMTCWAMPLVAMPDWTMAY